MPATKSPTEHLHPVVDILKALADETRLRMANLLREAGELCACEIEETLRVNQSNASRHLARLRAAGIISARREGQWVHYSLHTREDGTVEKLVEHAVIAARERTQLYLQDLEQLEHNRRNGFSCATADTPHGKPAHGRGHPTARSK